MRKLFIALGALGLGLSATACNTIDGAGEDIDSVVDEVDEEI